MSLKDVVSLIEQHREANKDQYDYSNKNKSQTVQGEKMTFYKLE